MTKDAPAPHTMSQNRLPALAAIAAESVLQKARQGEVFEKWRNIGQRGGAGADLRPVRGVPIEF